jgi:hypothetical protein
MLSETLETVTPTVAAGGAADIFTATMAEGLHALAQPLTILRSTVALMAAPEIPEAARQRYLNLSSEQVQRACDLFECLQDLVIANQVDAIRAPFAISKLIAAATDDPKIESAVKLQVVAPGDLPSILGDYARILQALAAALKVAASLSSAGDTVELRATPGGGFLHLAVSNAHAHRTTLNSSQRLALALAEANVRSQRGRFKFAEDPFCVSIELPLAW